MPVRVRFKRVHDRNLAAAIAILTSITVLLIGSIQYTGTQGVHTRLGAKPPCGSGNVPHARGRWTPVSLDPPSGVAELHDLAKYNCGDISLSSRVNTARFLCGHLSNDDVQRAFKQFSWQWEPAQCHLPGRFSSEMDRLIEVFLKRTQGSKVVFIGDSFAYEQYLSLRCLLGKHVVSDVTPAHFVLTQGMNVQCVDSPFLVDKATLRVMLFDGVDERVEQKEFPSKYIENKRLQRDVALSRLEDEFTWETYNNPSGVSYVHHVMDDQAFLVLNTGPHWHGNMTGYGTMVMNVLRYLQKHFQGKRVFVRASSQGHAGCEQASHPQNFNSGVMQKMPYNWRLLEHYNAIWRYEIQRLNDDRFVFLDIYPMSVERADGHSLTTYKNDCLHYCLPGVVDYWNLLLMSYIIHSA